MNAREQAQARDELARRRLQKRERERVAARPDHGTNRRLCPDAGRRRIVARALQAQDFTVREIAHLLGVSRNQAWLDLAETRAA